MKKIKYYFDFLSPYSYFCWLNLNKMKEELNFEIDAIPVVLAKLLNANELKGPGEITAKREFLLRQCFRYAHKNNIDFITPKTHPFNPLYVLRMATKACAGDDQHKVIDCLWKGGWQKRIDLSEPDELIGQLNACGLNGEDLLEKSYARESKLELKQNTKEAIELGAFGVPTMVVDEEFFWGNDSLEDIKNKLLSKDNWNQDLYHQVLATTERGAGEQSLSI